MWQTDPVEIAEICEKIRSIVSLLLISTGENTGNIPTIKTVNHAAMVLWDSLLEAENLFEKFSSEADGLRQKYNYLKRIMNEANAEQAPKT